MGYGRSPLGQSPFQQVRCALQVLWGESWAQNRAPDPSTTSNEDTAGWLRRWLISQAERLRNPHLPVLLRRRLAWSVLPEACIGRTDDERVASEVAGALERDAARLALAPTTRREDSDHLREKYAPSQGPRDLWLYLTEAVRFTAEHLQEILETWARPDSVARSAASNEASLGVQAAFMLIVFDTLCHGYGQYLDEESACAALQAWTLKQRTKGHGRWATIERLLRTRRPYVSEDTMIREWKLRRGEVQLKALDVLMGISAHTHDRIHELAFDPIPVRLLTLAILEADLMRSHVRHPVRAPPGGTTRPTPDVSDALWSMVADWLPKHQPRGRPPLDDRVALAEILQVLRVGARWNDVPRGSTLNDRYLRWEREGVLGKIIAAAQALGELPTYLPPQARPSHRGRRAARK